METIKPRTFLDIKKSTHLKSCGLSELEFRIMKICKIRKETNEVCNSDIKLARYDKGFKQWVTKAVTAWCTLEKDGELESFQNKINMILLDVNSIDTKRQV